jgi:hypothetical protein
MGFRIGGFNVSGKMTSPDFAVSAQDLSVPPPPPDGDYKIN